MPDLGIKLPRGAKGEYRFVAGVLCEGRRYLLHGGREVGRNGDAHLCRAGLSRGESGKHDKQTREFFHDEPLC
jgi:hypothetical protein